MLNETTLYSDGDFTATLESGSLTISVTVGGFLTYNVLKSELGAPYLESHPHLPFRFSSRQNRLVAPS